VASLLVIQGTNTGVQHDLGGLAGAATIGREAGNLIRLDDSEISRRHAEIRRIGDRFRIADLKSSNGTFLNDRQIEQADLRWGDRIRVGQTVLAFTDGTGPIAAGLDDVVTADGLDGSHIVAAIREDDSIAMATPLDTHDRWLARARGSLQVMYRTAMAVSHTLDIDELLGRILDLVFDWVAADRGCIMLVDPASGALTTRARRDRHGDGGELVVSRTILDYVVTRREGVITSDARDDDRFSAGNSVIRTGIREAICVPMQGRYGMVGAIYVDTTTPLSSDTTGPAVFGDDHLKLLVAIGNQAALAVEDTSYYSALVQAERLAAIGETIATVSHHIKNILQGIRGGSYLVEMGLADGDTDTLRKGWGIVSRNQDKIASLVMDMLTFSKTREPELAPADLGAVVTEVVETVRQRAAAAGVAIRWQPRADLPLLLFDAEGMFRAILNVVTNALDSVEERPGPAIGLDVAFDETARLARVTVSDNGAGIAEEARGTIFDLFVSTKGTRGTGLGLPVSRKILREHGGDIRCTSSVGQGSTFVLEFPLRLADDVAAASVAAPPAPDPAAEGERP
jgi:signal transduction histidine kinase/pSer/pThr/pTyr-binding forkhead associated (FHA) protein